MSNPLNWKIRNAASGFKGTRAVFYLDLASVMAASPSETVTKILAKYAERYKSQTIGVLCRHWLDRFQDTGKFSESIRGTVPDEDLASLSASETAGDLRLGLQKLGEALLVLKTCKTEITKMLVSAFLVVLILHAYIGMQAWMVMPQLEAAMKGKADFSQLGKPGLLFTGAHFVQDWWWVWVGFVVGGTVLTAWALKNYVGKGRHWLDDNVLPFQMSRDFNAAAFFSTLGTITAPRNGNVVQLHAALLQMHHNAYPWLRWQISSMLENLAGKPNSKGEVFDTGITNQKTYYRILDISDYAEVPVMLQQIGEIILKNAPDEIRARATTVRVILMATCMTLMLTMYGGQYALTDAFKSAVQMKALSR
jgi:type II secretory pathway component PulF